MTELKPRNRILGIDLDCFLKQLLGFVPFLFGRLVTAFFKGLLRIFWRSRAGRADGQTFNLAHSVQD